MADKIELKPKAAETANLRQIIEWVAFNLEALEPAYDKAFRNQEGIKIHEFRDDKENDAIWDAQRKVFIALREGHLIAYGNIGLDVHWQDGYADPYNDFRIDTSNSDGSIQAIPTHFWQFDYIFWQDNCLLYRDEADLTDFPKFLAAKSIFAKTSDLYHLFPAPVVADVVVEPSKIKPQKPQMRHWIDFLDLSGEVVLNDMFTIAAPETNGQNYKIIRYLIKNPNRFISVQEIKEKALGGKDLDKRLTDFVAQINLNKDFGKLFFDTGSDSIRLNNPVSSERMEEKAIRRIRIKPA